MVGLKADLKRAKQHLAAGQNQEALDSIQDHLEAEVSDYMLFCFAALAETNLDHPQTAKDLYEKALRLDDVQTVAWQGIFKLYQTDKILADERGLQACDKMLDIWEQAEKRDMANDLKRNILLSLKRYDVLKLDLGHSPILLTKVLEKLTPKTVLSTSERELVELSFDRLKQDFNELSHVHLMYCHYLYANNREWCAEVKKYVVNHGNTDSWINSRLLSIICTDFFLNGVADKESIVKLQDATVEAESSLTKLLARLSDEDMTGALEIIDSWGAAQHESYPASLLSARLLTETEAWEDVLKVLNAILRRSDLSGKVISVGTWMKIRTLIELGSSDLAESTYSKSKPDFCEEFVIERTVLSCIGVEKDFGWRQKLEPVDALRSSIAESLHANMDVDLASVDQLVAASENWKDLLIVAEARLVAGKDCTSFLVKAAKMNPRSSRAFYLLGRALSSKNKAKARSCLERAVKVRPTNEQYVIALDEVLCEAKVAPAERLVHLNKLKSLSKRSRSILADLSMSVGDFDVAITQLQYTLRQDERDVNTWSKLAEAYASRGHLQASVSAYEQVLELDPGNDSAVPLIQVLLRLGKNELAVEHCCRCRENIKRSSQSVLAIDIFEAQARLRLVATALREDRRDNLTRVLDIMGELVNARPRIGLIYKLAGDAVIYLAGYNEEEFARFTPPVTWNITSRLQAVQFAIALFSMTLELNRSNALAWSDLSVAIMLRSKMEKDEPLSVKAVACLKKAISLSTQVEIKSMLWSRMAEAKRLCGSSVASQQHCLVRALQLNKANDDAWLRLAILYLVNGEGSLAHEAFETALKYNPQLAEAWCGWAAKADTENETATAMDMYRHSISIKPIPLAVCKYAAYLCESIRDRRLAFDSSTVMIQFEKVIEMCDRVCACPQLLLHVGVLAELFGYYSEAVDCLSNSVSQGVHLQRASIKNGDRIESPAGDLSNLFNLASSTTVELFEQLQKSNALYSDLFKLLEESNVDGLRDMFRLFTKSISIPLVIATIVFFDIPINDAIVAVLHEVLPRHELIDVFPTIMPTDVDRSMHFLEQDGEEPFRFRHHVAQPLYDGLAKARAELVACDTS